jgi:hypothetical protein
MFVSPLAEQLQRRADFRGDRFQNIRLYHAAAMELEGSDLRKLNCA